MSFVVDVVAAADDDDDDGGGDDNVVVVVKGFVIGDWYSDGQDDSQAERHRRGGGSVARFSRGTLLYTVQ